MLFLTATHFFKIQTQSISNLEILSSYKLQTLGNYAFSFCGKFAAGENSPLKLHEIWPRAM